MRKAAFAALLLVLIPLQASALDTEELLGLVAMPLAVAAASEVTGVPVGDLSHFVATLNRAQVPPTQIVQVVRYAPAALVVQDPQPTFVEYVDTQVDQGITGTRLVTVIEDRYQAYDLDPQFIAYEEPATTYVVRDDYIPQTVVTRVAEYRPAYVVNDTNDLLALAAMPLAVAAVADITGIPFGDLSSFVASLNAAQVPAVQVVEVLRYSPVVLVDDTARPEFIRFVDTQVDNGLTGLRLVEVIDDRLLMPAVVPTRVVDVVDGPAFFPAVVTTRVAEVRGHPHGGPPGQLKKDLGLQTGAEVVHGTRRGRVATPRVVRTDDDGDRRVVRRAERPSKRVTKSRPAARERVERPKVERVERKRVERPKVERVHPQRVVKPKQERGNRGRGGGAVSAPPAAAPQVQGGGHGQGHGQGKGKGKGKG